jgi:AsmA protein
MKRTLLIVGAVIVLILGAVAILPQLIPSDVYRQRIEAIASETLGRKVAITGKVGVSIFPRIEARAGGAFIANPDGFGDAPFASMKELRAAVKIIPLIFRRIEVDEFVLVAPSIALVSLENGTNNWTFKIGAPKDPNKPEKPSDLNASLGDVRIINGQVSYDNRATKQIQTLQTFELKADMQATNKPFKVIASGIANGLPFKLDARVENPKAMMDGQASAVTVGLDTELLKTSLDGTLSLGDKPVFDFKFDGQMPSAVKLADAMQVQDLPLRSVLGRISASGQAYGTPDDITLKVADARHESALLNADFKGDVRIADFITLNIEANADAPRLADLARAMNIDAPGGDALGKATATTRVTGKLGDLTFSNVNFRHDSGLLGITFAGNARLNTELTYAGRVSILAPDLKQLAAAAGAKLPAGNVYRSFALTGETSGGTSNVLLKNAVVEFDDIRGTGEAALSFSGRPKLTGALSTGPIDTTPYAAASGAPQDAKKSGGWGDDPVDLSPLKLADADLTIKAETLKFQRFDFGPSNVLVTLKDGRLVADIKQTSLFGGAGDARLVADGSGTLPAVGIKANINGLALKPFLNAAAGFDMLEGSGSFQIDMSGSGATVQSLMSSLAGSGKLDFGEGLLRGVNLPELGKAAQTALTTRSIPLSAFGNNAQTRFGDMKASFTMAKGVAAMADLKLDSDVISVSGGGNLDIGQQKLSLSLYPEYKNKNEGVKGYGLPVKLSGSWTGVNLSLDYDWLIQRAAGDARARVSTEIEKELRKQLGDDFSTSLGLGAKPKPAMETKPAATNPPPAPAVPGTGDGATPAPSIAPAPTLPKSTEDKLRGEAKKALGNLFKN